MPQRDSTFNYSGAEIPPGGTTGDVLVKIAAANYYTAWRNLTEVFNTYDTVFDDGEY